MFESMKVAGALAGLMKNREALEAAAERTKERIRAVRTEAESGGGAVRVRATGDMRIESVRLAPAAVVGAGADDTNREMVEGLIAEATNAALELARREVHTIVRAEAQAMGLGDLPGIERLLGEGAGAGA